MEQGEKDYFLQHSNNISNNKGQTSFGGGMNNPFVPSSQTVPASSEQVSYGFVPILDDETNGTKLKEMGEHEIYQFENLIQSLSPEKKHSLLYSILQHQHQHQILNMMENLPLTTSTASNNISSLDSNNNSNNNNTNVMNYSYNSESVQSSSSPSINININNNSNRNIHHHYQHEQQQVDNNSNDLMNANITHRNGNVSDFQSITPLEELWFQRSVSHSTMENESLNHGGVGRTPQHQQPVKQQQQASRLVVNNAAQSSNLSCSLPNRSIYPQSSMESTLFHRTIDHNMMFGNSFPPSNTSSADLQQLMQAYYRQQFMQQNQDCPLPFEQGDADEQQPQLPNDSIIRNILSVSKGVGEEEVEYILTPNNAVRCSNGNEKANPEKGSWANKANLGSKLCVATTQSDSLNYHRGSSKIRPSSLANHLQGDSDRITTRRVNNGVVDDEHFSGAYLPIESDDEDFTHQNCFPQCEDKTPNNSIGYSNGANMVKPVMNQANIGENESFNKQTNNNHQTCTFEGPTTTRNETYYIPTCQPYVSSFSSCTTETRPSTDANPNQSNSSSAHPFLTNKKETQPSIGQTSGETLNSPSSSSTRASTTITRTLNNSTNSNTTTATTPVFISGGDNSLNNTSTSITNSTIFRNNVPSVNSSIVGSTTTTNIQQQQQDVYFYPNNQLGEEQSFNSSGNIEQVVYRNHHAAVMNSNLQFPNITNTSNNCVSYQIPPQQQQQQTISPSLLQQQQNLYILQQHLQNFPQSSQQPFNGTLPQVNQFPNHHHFQASNPPDRHELTKRTTIQESNESEDEPYLPKQFSVLPPSSKRRMKRKTTNQTSKDTTIANVPSNTVASLNSNLLKKMTVDMYYDITSAGHPFLPREDLENLSVNDDQRTNLAFMFSLQTLCYQRFGLTKQAHDSFEKAKNLVLFNPTDPNLFNAACTYVNLALYCNSSGDPENAKKFSRILDYNILRDDSFRDSQNPEQLKALIQMKKISDISGGTGYYGDERGLNDVSKFILSIYQYSTGGERPVPPEMMQIARQPLNMETLPEYLSLLDCVMKMMLIYESKGLHFSETQKKMTKYLYYGLSYGMKILLLKLCGIKGPELEEAAEKITLLCRTPTFTFAPTFLIQPVGLALDIHCEMLKEIDQGERSNIEEFKIAKLLRKDIESLRFLNSRYPELCANFNPALEQADTLLEKKGRSLSRFLDAEIYSSNSGGVTIIEDELKFIEGQIKESAKLKRKSREEEEEKVNQDGFGNTPSSSMATSSDMNLNMQLPNSAGFIPIISEDFPKSYGLDPLTFLSEEDYELLFGEDQKSVNNDY